MLFIRYSNLVRKKKLNFPTWITNWELVSLILHVVEIWHSNIRLCEPSEEFCIALTWLLCHWHCPVSSHYNVGCHCINEMFLRRVKNTKHINILHKDIAQPDDFAIESTEHLESFQHMLLDPNMLTEWFIINCKSIVKPF